MNWKEAVADFSSNIFPDIPNKQNPYDIGQYEPSPSMPLQMFLFFNVFFFPFWIASNIFFLHEKFYCFGHLTQFLSIAVISMISIIEIARLYLGYIGNLSEKIPELAGFWMLSILLQFPLFTFLLVNPYLLPRPTEITLNSVIWLILQSELVTGFFALKKAAYRAKQYYSLRSHLKSSYLKGNTLEKNTKCD